MPKVVIELQANTQDAVNKIQQFARAQKDAFDAIKAGNPALQDAYVKVGQLSDSTKNAAQVTGEFNRASRALASGGIRELAGGIPVVTETLVGLSHTLRGFPAILLGVVGAGAAFIAYLKSVEAQADKTAKSIASVGDAIQSQTQALAARVGGIRAGAAGNLGGAAAAEFRATEIEAEAARKRALEAAGETRAGAITMADRALGLVNPQALLDKQKLADADYQKARAKADADANYTITLAREKLKADLVKIEEDLDKQLADAQEKRVQDAEKAAEKQKKLIEDLLSPQSLKFLEQFGKGFEDLGKQLDLEANLAKSREAITQLEAAIAAGMDKNGLYAKGITAIKEKMEEAIKQGFWPAVKAIEAVAKAEELAAFNAEEWHKRIEEMLPGIDALINKGKAIQDAKAAAKVAAAGAVAAGTTGGGTAAAAGSLSFGDLGGRIGAFTGAGGSGFGAGPFGGATLPEEAGPGFGGPSGSPFAGNPGAGLLPSGLPDDMPSFATGGIVPGLGPVPIIAHGGERILPRGSGGGGGGRPIVRIEPGAIRISGTIVQQTRDWDVLVEHLAQTISARLR